MGHVDHPAQPHAPTDTRYCQIYRPLNNRGFDAPHARHTQPIRYVVDSQKHGIPHRCCACAAAEYGRSPVLGATRKQATEIRLCLCVSSTDDFVHHRTETLCPQNGQRRSLPRHAQARRGHYRLTVRSLSENVALEPDGSVTSRYAAMLEETIRRNPSIWLWSHRRWKWERQATKQTRHTSD